MSPTPMVAMLMGPAPALALSIFRSPLTAASVIGAPIVVVIDVACSPPAVSSRLMLVPSVAAALAAIASTSSVPATPMPPAAESESVAAERSAAASLPNSSIAPADTMVIVSSAVTVSVRTLLPAVGPVLPIVTDRAKIDWSATSPLAAFVLPAPERSSIVTVPLPASIVVLAAILMTAVPASRCESTTPLANRSLAMIVRSPSSVVMLAFRITLRPACNVSDPPAAFELATTMGALMVKSLLA